MDDATRLTAALRLLLKYERWEADVLLEDACWAYDVPRPTQDLWDRWMDMQRERTAVVLGSAARPMPAPFLPGLLTGAD